MNHDQAYGKFFETLETDSIFSQFSVIHIDAPYQENDANMLDGDVSALSFLFEGHTF